MTDPNTTNDSTVSNTQYASSSEGDDDPVEVGKKLIVGVWPDPADEWRQRTVWGRLKFPLWLLGQMVFVGVAILAVAIIAGPEIVIRLIGRLIVELNKRSPEMPDTYRGEQ